MENNTQTVVTGENTVSRVAPHNIERLEFARRRLEDADISLNRAADKVQFVLDKVYESDSNLAMRLSHALTALTDAQMDANGASNEIGRVIAAIR